jgi:hypothetical protein
VTNSLLLHVPDATLRPADSTNPTVDMLTDLVTDVPQWAMQQASIGFESAQAILGVRSCLVWAFERNASRTLPLLLTSCRMPMLDGAKYKP